MYDTYASNMKTISARILMLIASANNYEVLTGDIKNIYLYPKNKLDVYVTLGKEFQIYDKSIKPGCNAIFEQNLYGLGTGARNWHAHLSDTLRSQGFRPTRHDTDIWIRKCAKECGNDYVGTHTNDLVIVRKDPQSIMTGLQSVYQINKMSPPRYHLGCDYEQRDRMWYIVTQTYSTECISRVEIFLVKRLVLIRLPYPLKLNLSLMHPRCWMRRDIAIINNL